MLNKKYLPKVLNSYSDNMPSGFTWINPFIKDIPLKDVMQIEFEGLYPNIICGLVKEGYHNFADSKIKEALIDYTEKVDFFYKNRINLKINDLYRYRELKKDINSFYGKLGYYSIVENCPNFPLLVTQYLKEYYTDFLDKNAGKILYIDVDTIFYCGSIDMLEINVKHWTTPIRYALFKSIKNYVTFDNEYNIFGFKKGDAKDAINLIKYFMRNNKIEELGI
jgi:hypothetical protein